MLYEVYGTCIYNFGLITLITIGKLHFFLLRVFFSLEVQSEFTAIVHNLCYCRLVLTAHVMLVLIPVGNVSDCRYVSDCRSGGREFDPLPVPYFRGD